MSTAGRTIDDLLTAARARIDRLSPADVVSEVADGAVVIDTRCGDAREAQGVIPGSVHVPLSVLFWRLDRTSAHHVKALTARERRIILVCADGYSSSLAAATLRDLGFSRAADLDGGFNGWAEAGFPVERRSRRRTVPESALESAASRAAQRRARLKLGGRAMLITSSSFSDGEPIPEKHGKNFDNVSPALSWSEAPSDTKSFGLAVLDRISPGNVYLHWLVCDIPPTATSLDEGASGTPRMPAGAREIKPYVGPFPPSGIHTYEFTLYALQAEAIDIGPGASLEEFERAVDGRTLATAVLKGTFASAGG
jgi:Raf kinase inhibitor-like YbhB/YbcL family protein